MNCPVLPHEAYSPNVAPSDIFVSKVEAAFAIGLSLSHSSDFYRNGTKELVHRWFGIYFFNEYVESTYVVLRGYSRLFFVGTHLALWYGLHILFTRMQKLAAWPSIYSMI